MSFHDFPTATHQLQPCHVQVAALHKSFLGGSQQIVKGDLGLKFADSDQLSSESELEDILGASGDGSNV